uniref:Neprosin PEP catalytic domain-containing protein n=1 Tax=Glycine max TaxID=3847 RepID=K7KVQ6_SOYBN
MKRHSQHSSNDPFCEAHNRTRQQHQCMMMIQQPNNDVVVVPEHTCAQQHQNQSPKLASSSFTSQNATPVLPAFVALLLLVTSIAPTALCHPLQGTNHTFRPNHELLKLRRVRAHLKKINKPPVKTIQSPDGDLIDCVLSHQQPAFDNPKLRGHKILDPPERPKGNHTNGEAERVIESFQLWSDSGEACPEGTVPIRRTTEEDILRASSIQRFGRKPRPVRRDSTGSGHEHAVVFVNGDQYYGAKASINVWAPRVTDEFEFSLSQMWVSPQLYGDNYPRFFTYWTTDAYQTTGCYNLLCSGFIQTNNRIAIGAAISPRSAFNRRQFDIGLMIWKDPKHGHWWLEFGSGLLVGYWPANMFSHLRNHASMVQFGGEIVNTRSRGYHTGTQMGSGNFAEEGFRKAAYFRNLQVVDWDNSLLPLRNIHQLADHSNCYNIRQGTNSVWGTYFYYGGPGRNVRCP